jgi:hypothetical protein
MKTENEIREYLADCKEAVKELDKMQDSLQACKYEGIVEGLEFALSDTSLVTKEEQSKLNSIADFILHQNYPKSANGIFAYSTAYDIDYDVNGWGRDDKGIEIIVFEVVYGQKDDCHNTTHSVDMKVRRDVLNQWGGNGLPQLEED